MSYQVYRNTTLGHTLQESLDELIPSGEITPELAQKALLQFDKEISNALSTRVKNRVSFQGKLHAYRLCDDLWTFILNDVEFREGCELDIVDKVQFVACDGSVLGVGKKLPRTMGNMACESQSSQLHLYISVVNDVIENVCEAVLMDEQLVLLELKQLWLSKLQQSKAVRDGPSEQEKLLNMYGMTHAVVPQARQRGQIQQQQHRSLHQTLQLQQQGYLQQQQQQQQQVQALLPTAILNSQGPGWGDASLVGESSSAATPASSEAPSIRYQLPTPAGGGQIITQQHRSLHQTLQLQQQGYLQQQQQQQQQVQALLPTAILNSLGPGWGDASLAGESSSAAAPASSEAPSVRYQLLIPAGGGQIITHNIPQGFGQFLVQGGTVPQGQQLQVSATQLQQAVQQQQAQQHQQARVKLPAQRQAALSAQLGGQHVIQLDGTKDSSSDEDDDDDDDDDDNADDKEAEDNLVESDPLNSDDDVSEEDLSELCDNIVVCQYDKIERMKSRRRKWRYQLKDGIMNLNGKDYVFQEATGVANW